MQNFGFKIVDRKFQDIRPVVESAIANQRPLEVGLYFNEREAADFLTQEVPRAELPRNTHFDHNKLNIFELHKHEDILHTQIERSLELKADYAITHTARYPVTPRPAHRKMLLEKLLDNLHYLDGVLATYGLQVHVENTFHSIDFYRRLMTLIQNSGFSNIHYCFDLGHAKVWSVDTLPDWFDFLADFQANHGKIHFHLHANRGLHDDHLSFVTAEKEGITAADHYTGNWDYYQVMNEMAKRFPHSRKVFEVPPTEALDNMDLVMDRLDILNYCQQQMAS